MNEDFQKIAHFVSEDLFLQEMVQHLTVNLGLHLILANQKGSPVPLSLEPRGEKSFLDLMFSLDDSQKVEKELATRAAVELSHNRDFIEVKALASLNLMASKFTYKDDSVGIVVVYGYLDNDSFKSKSHEVLSAVRKIDPRKKTDLEDLVHTIPLFDQPTKVSCRLIVRALSKLVIRSMGRQRRRSDFLKWKIVGQSVASKKLNENIDKISKSRSTVLITGENGTGKELVARNIHLNSDRRDKTFMAVNCGALHENLLESELFGHVAGAFTGAVRNRKGLFVAAEGGTLFLDEIGEMSEGMQVKLLRAIQERQITPMGGNDSLSFDVRILAATNRNLQKMVEQGKFRQDLFYRLQVIEIEVAPLRARKEDIDELIDHFLFLFREDGVDVEIPKDVREKLKSYTWPGNIRQLKNEIERICVLGQTGSVSVDLLSNELSSHGGEQGDLVVSEDFRLRVQKKEEQAIRKALLKFNWNKSKTARELGVTVAVLNKRITAMGIKKI